MSQIYTKVGETGSRNHVCFLIFLYFIAFADMGVHKLQTFVNARFIYEGPQ